MKPESSPAFVVGCCHSGTSIFLRILGAHSRLCAIPFESKFALKWPTPCDASRQFFDHCNYYTQHMGKVRWVEKTPDHILRLKEIIDYFPGAKIFLVLRDGRDVACSIRDRCGSLEEGIDLWVDSNRSGQKFWKHSNVQVVRYERLVTEMENTVRGATDFLGEEFEDSLLHYYETTKYYLGTRIDKPPNSFGGNMIPYRNWQINQPLFDGRGKWQGLSPEDKNLIKEKAGDMLIEYGYASDRSW